MAHQPVLLAITIYLLHYHEIGEQLSPCPPVDFPKVHGPGQERKNTETWEIWEGDRKIGGIHRREKKS